MINRVAVCAKQSEKNVKYATSLFKLDTLPRNATFTMKLQERRISVG